MSYILVLRIARIATLVLASIVAYLSIKSFRRTDNRVMLFLGSGFAFIAGGALLAGVLFELLETPLELSFTVESLLAVIGLGLIVSSIYGVSWSTRADH